jgi:hypothetical protein
MEESSSRGNKPSENAQFKKKNQRFSVMNSLSFIYTEAINLQEQPTKTWQDENVLLERATTDNALYNLLLCRTKSGSCLNKGIVFKIRHCAACTEDSLSSVQSLQNGS